MYNILLLLQDILTTCILQALRDRGVEFLHVPDTYYDDLLERVGEIKEDINALRSLNILVDRDDEDTSFNFLLTSGRQTNAFLWNYSARRSAIFW